MMLSKFMVTLPKSYATMLTFLIEKKMYNTVEAVLIKGIDLIIEEELPDDVARKFLEEHEESMMHDSEVMKEQLDEFVAPRQICMYCTEWKRNHVGYDGWCCQRSRNFMYDDTCDRFESI